MTSFTDGRDSPKQGKARLGGRLNVEDTRVEDIEIPSQIVTLGAFNCAQYWSD
jgi:hypothetical protein